MASRMKPAPQAKNEVRQAALISLSVRVGCPVFQHVFAEMNDMLQEIIRHYPTAQGARREELLGNWNLLRRLCDEMMDEWLAFAEKMSDFQLAEDPGGEGERELGQNEAPELRHPAFARGQGYFKLLMYPECVREFGQVLGEYPDSVPARLYSGLALLHSGDLDGAWTHLQQMLPGVRSRRLKAFTYNVMGCILARQGLLADAQDLFSLALKYAPDLQEPAENLKVCRRKEGELQYGMELVSLL